MVTSELEIVARARDQLGDLLPKINKELKNMESVLGKTGGAMGTANKHAGDLQGTLGSVRAASEKARGGLGGLVDTLGKLGLAGMGISALAGAARGLGDALGIGLNVEMENTKAQLMAFTKDGAKAEAILQDIRKEADKTPFAFNEMAKATAGLMPAAKASGAALMDLVKQAEILAASNPAQGLEGAAFALREAVSGDFTSVIERFNLPRSYINKLKEEGVPALEIVSRAMKEMGYDTDLVSNLANTASGRWSTFLDTIDGIKVKLSKPIFEALSQGLSNVQRWLDDNKDVIDDWATKIAAVISVVLDGLGGMVNGFGNALGDIWSVVSELGQAIYEALQWLNPFASHSPPLVDQVEDGMDIVKRSFASVTSVIAPIKQTGRAIVDFGSMTKDAAKDAVAKMKDSLDDMKEAMEATKGRVDDLKESLKSYRDTVKELSGTQITGAKEYQEKLTGIETGIMRVQLALNNAKMANASKESMKGLEEQLDKLRLQADNVRLEERLKFDPLKKQIKDLVNPLRELPFEEIVNGIKAAQAAEAALAPELAKAEELWRSQQGAVKEQEKVLKAAQVALNDMKDAAKGAASGVGAVTSAADGLKENMNNVKQQINEAKQKFEDMKASVTASVEGMIAPLRALTTPVANLVGVFTGAKGAGLDLHNALERLLGLEAANFLIGLVQGAQDLQANLGPLVDQGIVRLQQAMADLAPTGERLSKLFDTIKSAVVALVPKVLDVVSGLGDMARKSVASGDALKTLTDVVNTVSRAIGDVSKFVQDHTVVQAVLVGVLASAATAWTLIKVVTLAQAVATGIVTTVTGLWTAAQWLLNAALTANPIGIVVVLLAGLAAALIYAYNNSEDFRKIVDDIARFLRNVLAFAIESVRRKFEELTGALDAVNKFQSDVLKALGELAEAALRLAGEIGDNIIQGITNGINAGWTWLSNLVGNLAQELLKKAKAVLGISSPSKEFFRVGQFIIDGLVAGLKSRNTTLIDAITSTVGNSINLMESLISRKVGGLNASILSRGASAAESFQKLLAEKFDDLDIMFGFPNLPGIFSQISAASKDVAMVGQIKDVLDAMREMGLTIDQNVIQQFKNLGQELGGPFKEQLDKLLGSLGEQDALKGLKDFLADADLGRQLAATASQLQSLGQAMPDTLKKLLESVPRVGGGILDTIIKQLLAGAIPGFAAGGVVPGPANQPALAVVHGGERITPAGGPSGNTYHFNMTVNSQAPVDSTIANFALMRAMVGG